MFQPFLFTVPTAVLWRHPTAHTTPTGLSPGLIWVTKIPEVCEIVQSDPTLSTRQLTSQGQAWPLSCTDHLSAAEEENLVLRKVLEAPPSPVSVPSHGPSPGLLRALAGELRILGAPSVHLLAREERSCRSSGQ